MPGTSNERALTTLTGASSSKADRSACSAGVSPARAAGTAAPQNNPDRLALPVTQASRLQGGWLTICSRDGCATRHPGAFVAHASRVQGTAGIPNSEFRIPNSTRLHISPLHRSRFRFRHRSRSRAVRRERDRMRLEWPALISSPPSCRRGYRAGLGGPYGAR